MSILLILMFVIQEDSHEGSKLQQTNEDRASEREQASSNVYPSTSSSSRRTKRGVVHLARVMNSRLSGTGYNHKSFWNYGNWCGSGGTWRVCG
jgi:hypothetical protein